MQENRKTEECPAGMTFGRDAVDAAHRPGFSRLDIATEADLQRAKDRLVELAGAQGEEARLLVNDIEDYVYGGGIAARRKQFKAMGKFLAYRGDLAAWRAVYLHLMGDPLTHSDAMGVREGGVYEPGDEFLAALGEGWREYAPAARFVADFTSGEVGASAPPPRRAIATVTRKQADACINDPDNANLTAMHNVADLAAEIAERWCGQSDYGQALADVGHAIQQAIHDVTAGSVREQLKEAWWEAGEFCLYSQGAFENGARLGYALAVTQDRRSEGAGVWLAAALLALAEGGCTMNDHVAGTISGIRKTVGEIEQAVRPAPATPTVGAGEPGDSRAEDHYTNLAQELFPAADPAGSLIGHHNLADVAAVGAERAWNDEGWWNKTYAIERAVSELLPPDLGPVTLTRPQVEAVDRVLGDLSLLVAECVDHGARLGFALAATDEHRSGGARAWLGAAHAALGQSGCATDEHLQWLSWTCDDVVAQVHAAKQGKPFKHLPRPWTDDPTEDAGQPTA